MEENNQVLEATNSNEELELELELDDTEDIEALREQVKAKDTFARQAIARAKTAEAKLKALEVDKKPEVTQNINQTLSPEDVEVRILEAAGKSEEEINLLRKIASINNTTIIKAQTDPFFISYQEQLEAKAKAEKARLGASKNGGSVRNEKTFNSPSISDEDHKAMWKQAQG